MLAPHLRNCPACGTDAGAPNVRLANKEDEVVQLEMRYSRARIAAADVNAEKDFDAFVKLASESDAVICMPCIRLLDLLRETSLLSTFGLQLEGESRVPQDNRFDNFRESVESALFPNFSKEIRFAALTIRDVGQTAYGVCSVILRKSSIAGRASVFEYPLFDFAEKTGQQLGQPIRPGHRASWGNRAKLVAAKFGAKCAGLNSSELAELLLPAPTDTLSDCVEVHIFQSINRHSIAHVTLTKPTEHMDEVLQSVLYDELQKQSISARVAS
ncbi:hypothetical protein [Lysobacter brunescens]|uniref:Uncharacterized protein n=1 Tax=Lysobacter brunescens TaxID=262323 RepID=A0ABW2YF51_9GAMM